MKKEIKAALLSALVCPGVGQIYLRRYLRGLAMILVVLGGVGFMVMTTTMRALEHLETIQRAGTADVAAPCEPGRRLFRAKRVAVRDPDLAGHRLLLADFRARRLPHGKSHGPGDRRGRGGETLTGFPFLMTPGCRTHEYHAGPRLGSGQTSIRHPM